MVEILDPDAAWRQRFFAFLWSSGTPPAEFSAPGWQIYRNTTQRTCLHSLRANFPALAVLLGDAAFDILARAYLEHHRPDDARLMTLGADLPPFLSQFAAARDWPHLVDVALLDRCWTEAHLAPDDIALDARHALTGQINTQSICAPHPATRWHHSPSHPVATLWIDARAGRTERINLPWHAEGLMLTRPHDSVRASRISAAEAAFLDACAKHHTLEQALGIALATEPHTDLPALMAHMFEQGALTLYTP